MGVLFQLVRIYLYPGQELRKLKEQTPYNLFYHTHYSQYHYLLSDCGPTETRAYVLLMGLRDCQSQSILSNTLVL